jgi:hypothetical protein
MAPAADAWSAQDRWLIEFLEDETRADGIRPGDPINLVLCAAAEAVCLGRIEKSLNSCSQRSFTWF